MAKMLVNTSSEQRILHAAHEYDKHFNKIVFWSAVVLVVIGNFLASVVLVPFLAVLNKWFLDLLVVIIAFGMGFIYQFLIVDVKHLDRRHHMLAAFIVPVVAVVNVIIMVGVANSLIGQLEINNLRESPFVIALIYGVAFLVPVVYYLVRKKS